MRGDKSCSLRASREYQRFSKAVVAVFEVSPSLRRFLKNDRLDGTLLALEFRSSRRRVLAREHPSRRIPRDCALYHPRGSFLSARVSPSGIQLYLAVGIIPCRQCSAGASQSRAFEGFSGDKAILYNCMFQAARRHSKPAALPVSRSGVREGFKDCRSVHSKCNR